MKKKDNKAEMTQLKALIQEAEKKESREVNMFGRANVTTMADLARLRFELATLELDED